MATNKVKVVFDADGTGFHRTVTGITSALTGLKAKIAGAFGAIGVGMIARSMLQFGDEIQTIANNLNVSTDSAQRFAWAARNANIEMTKLQKTVNGFDILMQKWKGGSLDEKRAGLMRQLGLTGKDVDLKPDELFFKIMENTKKMKPETATSIFKQLGVKPDVANALIAERDTILSKKIPIVPEDQIKKLDALGDAFVNLKNVVIQALIPAFLAAAKWLTKGAGKFFSDLNEANVFFDSMKAQAEADGQSFVELRQLMTFNRAGFARLVGERLQKPEGMTDQQWADKKELVYLQQLKKQLESTYGPKGVEYYDNAMKEVEKAKNEKSFFNNLSNVFTQLEADLNKPPGTKDITTPYVREAITKPAEKTKATKFSNLGELSTSNFLKIGNLLGVDVRYRMERLQIQANNYLAKIADGIDQINEKMTAGGTTNEFGFGGD